jgi:hypothetical protein
VQGLGNGQNDGVSFFTVDGYGFEKLAMPHSRQRGFRREVINPQDGQILCDWNPANCGFSLRIQRSSRIVNSTISSPKEILVAFMKATLLGECRTKIDGQAITR